MNSIGIGIIGSQFIAELHVEAFKRVSGAQVVAVASPTQAHAKTFAEKHHIPKWFTDYQELLRLGEVQIVSLCLPNDLPCQATANAPPAQQPLISHKPPYPNLHTSQH